MQLGTFHLKAGALHLQCCRRLTVLQSPTQRKTSQTTFLSERVSAVRSADSTITNKLQD